MFCGRCGAKIAEGKKFCSQCGAQLGAARQDAGAPVQDASPPAIPVPVTPVPAEIQKAAPAAAEQPAVPLPATAPAAEATGAQAAAVTTKTAGGGHLKIIIAAIVIIVVVVTALLFLRPGGGTVTDADQATKASIREATLSVTAAADALDAGRTDAFLGMLSGDVAAGLKTQISIPESDRKTLAGAFRKATVSSANPDVVYFTMDFKGKPYSFYSMKEGTVWKIGGL